MKRVTKRGFLFLLAVATAITVVAVGCGKEPLTTGPEESSDGSFALNRGLAGLGAAVEVQTRHNRKLFEIRGVVATAVGFDESGAPVVKVYTETAEPLSRVPRFLDGMRVIAEESGPIVAFKGPPGGGSSGADHMAIQTPPIELGTSGGPADDIANGFCCGGTLGSLVKIGNTQYILSNSHVFAGDVVSGGNGRVSTLGDDVTQPGLIDVGCNAGNAQVVANLSSLSTLFPPNSTPNVDAAIAQARAGMVRSDGSILEIGTISAQTVGASVGQKVKKSGRTTGLTRSSVDGLNATISVGYSDECAGNSFSKTFTGQIIIKNRGSKFLNSGDSGSLMVEDVNNNPRAVGLLYAGSSTLAVANPIDAVLSHFGASMVGN